MKLPYLFQWKILVSSSISCDNQFNITGSRIKVDPSDLTRKGIIGSLSQLKVWKENPPEPTVEILSEAMGESFPIGLFLSLPKSLRAGPKQSYGRGHEMPSAYQDKFYEKMHWGQRKLLISEVQFFNYILATHDEEAIVLYAGAAHGTHILYLLDLFPNLRFDLYDPGHFNHRLLALGSQPYSRVRVFTADEGWFNNEIAKTYLPGGSNYSQRSSMRNPGSSIKLLVISDIRAHPPVTEDRVQSSQVFMKQAKEEMTEQADWARLLDADGTLLKFKIPYPAKHHAAFEAYVDGTILFQAWGPTPSSEMRLLALKEDLKRTKFYNIPFCTGI